MLHKSFLTQPRKILWGHDIKVRERARIVNYMIEIMQIFEQSEETVFRSILILDLYFKKRNTPIQKNELNILGVVSIFLASKLCERTPLTMRQIVKDICRSQFSAKTIRRREQEMFCMIDMNPNLPTLFTITSSLIEILNFSDICREAINKYAMLLLKMCVFESRILSSYTFGQLAAFCVIISMKLYENTHPGFEPDGYNLKIMRLFNLQKDKILYNLNFLRDYVSAFKTNYYFNSLQWN